VHPWVYDFRWDAGHVVFLGAFALVLTTVALVLLRTFVKTRKGVVQDEWMAIGWEEAFEALPAEARACRHALTGELPDRRCNRGFDCRECKKHASLVQSVSHENGNARGYHRGHAWVERSADGTFQVGLSDLGRSLMGHADEVKLPDPGTRLRVNGPAWSFVRDGVDVRILSPVDGVVEEQGDPEQGWFLKVRPLTDSPDLTHLLRGEEAKQWMRRETERLVGMLTPDGAEMVMADGGAPVDDLPLARPDMDWDAVWGEMFLDE
jgi:glycine cleavage system H lipoate-binding protein